MAEALSHLLVDARPVCHPTAGARGIGRYTMGLLGGLHAAGAPVVALYETAVEAAQLAAALPDITLQQLHPATVRQYTESGAWFLATQLMLHPIPLDPVPRIITESGLPVAAVMYDVIPERYPEQYQVRPAARAQVRLRGILTRTLDALLAISDFAADTAAEELRFPRDRIVTIGAGCDGQFAPAAGDAWPRLRNVLANDGRSLVVNVAGGSDPRKNVERLLRAWGTLPKAIRHTHRLAVVGTFDDTLHRQWLQWALEAGVVAEVLFTGSVTDEELVALHQVARLAIVPATEEGFGLPVLEAAACGCPVITSNVSALPEVLAEPTAEFDPYDVSAIASALTKALTDEPHRQVLLAAVRAAAQLWTWPGVGRATVAALEELGPRKPRALRVVPRRIALAGKFDDSSAGRANIAYAQSMSTKPNAPEITLLVDNSANDNSANGNATHGGPLRFPVRALGRFVHRSQFDDVIKLPVDA
ncbi:MAG: glycosyltransferase [Actinomycetia bacterium]|nr:glycosyltransferase [Actinomycetes bacterium]